MGHMSCETKWTGEGLGFEASVRSHKFMMDARADGSVGDKGPSPKEVLLASICACSGMDVASILKKMRLDIKSCYVNAETDTRANHPTIFTEVRVKYLVTSPDAKPDQVIKAVTLSMTKYCGVSAMVAPTSPITYEIFLNDQKIGAGKADFTEAESHA